MNNIFSYFFQAGAGLACGLCLIGIPAFKLATGKKIFGRRSR